MKINARKGGFTLVEIMIVVAIIALLASIAVPNFIRARQRSQATLVKNELRMIEGAIDQYAIEYNKNKSDTVKFTDIQAYIKQGSPLYLHGGSDSMNGVVIATGGQAISDGVKAPKATDTALSDVTDSGAFWSPYAVSTN